MTRARTHLPISLWTLGLGITGFAAGFFGPIILNPDANQGPLLGLFITGPGGAAGGLLLGALFRWTPFGSMSRSVHVRTWLTACASFGLAILFFCLPSPKVLSHIIEAEVARCDRASQMAPESLAVWQDAANRATCVTPPADWQSIALRNADHASGVVLTMKVTRRATIYEHRKPWNHGHRTASAWQTVHSSERYYASEFGHDCDHYLSQPTALYMPYVRKTTASSDAHTVWPPTDVTSFLRLMELGPVPHEYRDLLERRVN